ncbi:MAG: hypothetical protein AB9872_00615 [Solidesulfovibrio sp.]
MSEQGQDCREGQDWVTVSSFFTPLVPEPAFEDIIAAEVARWSDTAREAGLVPETHIRVSRGESEVAVEVSPALNAFFTPKETLWRAV